MISLFLFFAIRFIASVLMFSKHLFASILFEILNYVKSKNNSPEFEGIKIVKGVKHSLTSKHVFIHNPIDTVFIRLSVAATGLWLPHGWRTQKRCRINLVSPWLHGIFQKQSSGQVIFLRLGACFCLQFKINCKQ